MPGAECAIPDHPDAASREEGLVDQKSVLAVFAHPDDEAFGVGGALKMYADRGAKTALV